MTWRVPYLRLGAQYANQLNTMNEAFERVMSNGDFILRADVEIFEGGMAQWLRVPYVIGVGSGSDALRLSVIASGIGAGDEVITVKHTFHATIEAIHHVGATPVFIGIGDDYCMDVNEL